MSLIKDRKALFSQMKTLIRHQSSGKIFCFQRNQICIFGISDQKIMWQKRFSSLNKEGLFPTVKHDVGIMIMREYIAIGGIDNFELVESQICLSEYVNEENF